MEVGDGKEFITIAEAEFVTPAGFGFRAGTCTIRFFSNTRARRRFLTRLTRPVPPRGDPQSKNGVFISPHPESTSAGRPQPALYNWGVPCVGVQRLCRTFRHALISGEPFRTQSIFSAITTTFHFYFYSAVPFCSTLFLFGLVAPESTLMFLATIS